ncbi:MAG TPA: HNH endonuclease family protein [Kribbella sp.]
MTAATRFAACLAASALVTGCTLPPAGAGPGTHTSSPTAPQPTTPATTPAIGTAKAIQAELARARVVANRTEVPGYARDKFGKRWTDQHDGLGGHNGCGTRDDILARQLTDVRLRSGSRCVVESGTLADPYTGRQIAFRKSQASKVQIDHIFALSRAWDLGASRWPQQRRTDFANDQASNLLAVDGATNASKGDKGPGEWMPVAVGYRCTWVLRYLKVANSYQLAITRDDQAAARTITRTCA